MEQAPANATALKALIQGRFQTLIQSFENILEEAMLESSNDRPGLLSAVDRSMRMDLTSQGIIRASEDLVRIIRQMQEMWIIGKLDSIPDVPQTESQREDLVKLASQLIQDAIDGDGVNGSK